MVFLFDMLNYLKYTCMALVLPLAAPAQSTDAPWQITDGIDWVMLPAAHNDNVSQKQPMAFANANHVHFDATNSGTLNVFDDGTVLWTLGIASERAENMNVLMSNVKLSEGEAIYVYGVGGADVQRYTKPNVRNQIQTFPIDGDSIVIEYQGRGGKLPQMNVDVVNCGFLPLGGADGYNKASGSCEVDASCNPMVARIKQSVCKLVVNGRMLGSGVLINNTSGDKKPYIITAAHCFSGCKFESCLAQFNYERVACSDAPFDNTVKLEADSMLCFFPERDVALLRLSSAPPASAMAYLSGWDLTEAPQGNIYCVHHPSGDYRKVSVAAGVMADTYNLDKSVSGAPFDAECHWHVSRWLSGTTEGGSSGSGLWSSDGYLIGNLTGGRANCVSPVDDYFYRLNSSWDYSNDTYRSLAEALDPKGTGVTRHDGTYIGSAEHVSDHFNLSEKPVLSDRRGVGAGYLTGHNTLRTTALAERFGAVGATTEVHGVTLVPMRAAKSNGQSFGIVVWDDDNGKPGAAIKRMANVPNSRLKVRSATYIEFDAPVTVNGPFFVGVEIGYDAVVDTLAFRYERNAASDGARVRVGDKWVRLHDVDPLTQSATMFFGYRGGVVAASATDSVCADGASLQWAGNILVVRSSDIRRAEVFDIDGRLVRSTEIEPASVCQIDLSGVGTGVYIVRIGTANCEIVKKILKRNR